jgi:DNA repair exonuclease SbcCD ATPase subunit
MVGIITHIPELREEFDQRLLIEKEAGASRVRIETA